jgi:hypothetical protein
MHFQKTVRGTINSSGFIPSSHEPRRTWFSAASEGYSLQFFRADGEKQFRFLSLGIQVIWCNSILNNPQKTWVKIQLPNQRL